MAVITTSGYDSLVTDSANSASAYATGHKSVNNAMGVYANSTKDPFDDPKVENIIELVKRTKGMATGIVSTANITDATPAAMLSHTRRRAEQNFIAETMTEDYHRPDVIMGGGSRHFIPMNVPGSKRKDNVNVVEQFKDLGYTFSGNRTELLNTPADEDKILGLYQLDNMNVYIDRAMLKNPKVLGGFNDQPGLVEMTQRAIDTLSKNENGFFLMVEGGKIDWACHSNDAATVFHEVMDMDNAIKVAYEFYEQHPDETLIVVTADHETGGIVLGKGPYTLNLQALKSQKVSESGYTKIVNELRKKYKNQVPWEVIKQSLKDNFGFWDSIQLNEKQEASLKKVYDESFSGKEIDLTKSEYQQDEPLAAEAKRILDDIALVGWTSGGHSGGYVPVFAIGAGAQLFQGRIDNTEIPVKIAEAAGYPNN